MIRITNEALIAAIHRAFPHIEWTEERFFNNGWDHAVVILDSNLVFRTPKNPSYKDEFRQEIELLGFLDKRLNVGIPNYEFISDDFSIAAYRIVPGHELTLSLFQTLTASEKESAAQQIAGFLTILHATPKAITDQFEVRVEDEKSNYLELKANARELLHHRMNEDEVGQVENLLNELQARLDDIYERSLIHCDLTSEHILWDLEKKHINIIDFSDRAIGDPAVDFAGLFEYGEKYAERVYDLYGGNKDGNLLRRAKLYFQRIPISIMIDSIKGFPCTFEEGYQMLLERLS